MVVWKMIQSFWRMNGTSWTTGKIPNDHPEGHDKWLSLGYKSGPHSDGTMESTTSARNIFRSPCSVRRHKRSKHPEPEGITCADCKFGQARERGTCIHYLHVLCINCIFCVILEPTLDLIDWENAISFVQNSLWPILPYPIIINKHYFDWFSVYYLIQAFTVNAFIFSKSLCL